MCKRPEFSFICPFSFSLLLMLFSSGLRAQHAIPSVKDSLNSAGKHGTAAVFPEATGWVNDFEEVIDSATEAHLTKLITDHNRKTTNQISIVTISSISPYNYLSEYAKDLSNAWGVGEKEKNNGVTVIYSKALHEVRIATGYGIEKKLNDSECERIANSLMLPEFKTGNYGKGLIAGVSEIIRILEK